MADSISNPHKALVIPEVLASILLQADNATILQAQRVCQFWRDVVDTSPDLQVKLFYKPAPTCRLVDQTPSLNSLLMARSPDPAVIFFDKTTWPCKDGSWQRMLVCQPYIRNILVIEHAQYPWYVNDKPIVATELRFDPQIVHHAEQARATQLRAGNLHGYLVSLPMERRFKKTTAGGNGEHNKQDNHSREESVPRIVYTQVLAVPARKSFVWTGLIQKMFFARLGRAAAREFYDIVFVCEYLEFLDGLRQEEPRKRIFGASTGLEDWLRSVKAWVHIGRSGGCR
ncbi:hypothetical protein BJX64DRAFT_288234 [Aspergillus heterothallicus]